MVASNLWVVPSNLDLAATELELVDAKNREVVLRQAIQEMTAHDAYDYIVMDCPPSLGVLTVNALTAATEVFIPLQPHFFALQGLSKLFQTTALVARRLNRELKVTGVVLCLYESGTRLAADVTDDLRAFLEQSEPNAPWAGAKIFDSRIRRNIKLAEAPSFGQSIFRYASKCPGAQDYAALTREVEVMPAAAALPPLKAAVTLVAPAADELRRAA
jgi:chromosome partitioning protein